MKCRCSPSRLVVSLIAISAISHLSCGSGTPSPAPTAPTPASPRSVTVVLAAVSGTYQASAVAAFSDGTSRDVTTEVQWTTSDPDVAEVAANGRVTTRNAGIVEIRATYQSVIGAAQLAVAAPPVPALYTLSGVVRDAATGAAMKGAQAEVIDGPSAGKTATTDGTGRYVLTGLSAGSFRVYFRSTGHKTFPATVTLSGDQSLDIALAVSPPPQPPPPRSPGPVPPPPSPPAPPVQEYRVGGTVRDGLDQGLFRGNQVRIDVEGSTRAGWIDNLSTYALYLPAGTHTIVATVGGGGYAPLKQQITLDKHSVLDFVLTPLPGLLEGRFRDLKGSALLPIVCPGRIEILTGPDAGRFAIVPVGQVGSLPNVQPGLITVRGSAPGYRTEEHTVRFRGDGGGFFDLCRLAGCQEPTPPSCQ